MGKFYFLFMISCIWFIHGNEGLYQQVVEDYSFGSTLKCEEANPERLWTFNGQSYLLNESGQWLAARYEVPTNMGKWLEDLARRGVCPKEHRGVYLDTSTYECGLWCCRGIIKNGERCPYHIDTQYPNGIPKGN